MENDLDAVRAIGLVIQVDAQKGMRRFQFLLHVANKGDLVRNTESFRWISIGNYLTGFQLDIRRPLQLDRRRANGLDVSRLDMPILTTGAAGGDEDEQRCSYIE